MKVISLYDFTGEAVKPWADAGYDCYCYDIQHRYWQKEHSNATKIVGNGSITYLKADLHNVEVLNEIYEDHQGEVAFLCSFPVCTDMAVSGSRWFSVKRAKCERFQEIAANYAIMCAELGERFGCPYYVENPVSVLSTLWRKPNYTFHPFEYGQYIPESEAEHPTYPDYIAPMDGYSKLTCIWSGNGFTMPTKLPVDCQSFGSSTQHRKLGGKSLKTKNIRSATPRGFAIAVFTHNCAIPAHYR